MSDKPDKLKAEFKELRQKIGRARESLLSKSIDEKAKEVGKSISEFSKDTYHDLDVAFNNVLKTMKDGTIHYAKDKKERVYNFMDEVDELAQMVRDKRREITGGKVEDEAMETLKTLEKRMELLYEQMKEELFDDER